MPQTIPTPVPVYAGDTAYWPPYTFTSAVDTPIDLVATGWTNWVAQWRPTPDSDTVLTLDVDDTLASSGTIVIGADAGTTAAMGSAGVWDLQSENGEVVRTWVRGKTSYQKDVTRV